MDDVAFNSLNYRWGLCVWISEDSCACHFIPLSTNVPVLPGILASQSNINEANHCSGTAYHICFSVFQFKNRPETYFPCFLVIFSLIAPHVEYRLWVGIGIICHLELWGWNAGSGDVSTLTLVGQCCESSVFTHILLSSPFHSLLILSGAEHTWSQPQTIPQVVLSCSAPRWLISIIPSPTSGFVAIHKTSPFCSSSHQH